MPRKHNKPLGKKFTNKFKKRNSRFDDMTDEEKLKYRLWCKEVKTRDKFRCQMPNCSHKCKAMHAHHIQRWADSPQLRFVAANGITLCRTCHNIVTQNESYYIQIFTQILNPQMQNDIYRIRKGLDETPHNP